MTPLDPLQAVGTEYLIYVPGHFRCDVCGFQLSKQTVSAQTGNIGITENNLLTEACPNDGAMMVKVTWKEAAESASERLTEVFNERDAAREQTETARCAGYAEGYSAGHKEARYKENWTVGCYVCGKQAIGKERTCVLLCDEHRDLHALCGERVAAGYAEGERAAYLRCAGRMDRCKEPWHSNVFTKWADETRALPVSGTAVDTLLDQMARAVVEEAAAKHFPHWRTLPVGYVISCSCGWDSGLICPEASVDGVWQKHIRSLLTDEKLTELKLTVREGK